MKWWSIVDVNAHTVGKLLILVIAATLTFIVFSKLSYLYTFGFVAAGAIAYASLRVELNRMLGDGA